METVTVNLGPRTYSIRIGAAAEAFVPFVRESAPASHSALIVFDTAVAAIASSHAQAITAAGYRCATHAVPSGEASKSPAELHRIYDALAAMPADRSTLVIAVGGGVIGDLAGFAAATFNRGLPLFMVPTTLLAMVDSSIGGKTGINHAAGKNLIGAFHQPRGVFINPDVLKTLPEREFNSGMAEVIKYSWIAPADCGDHAVTIAEWIESDPALIASRDHQCLEAIIDACCRIKAHIVERDEHETTGLRALLNFGHTFGHAYEKLSNYEWLHGEAVAAGMVTASRLAQRLGRVNDEDVESILGQLNRYKLPTKRDPTWPVDAIINLMRSDKKTTHGQLRFILPRHDGPCEVVDGVDEALVREVLAS